MTTHSVLSVQEDFTPAITAMPKTFLKHTSSSTKLYTLNQDYEGWHAGSLWVLKHNQFSWLAHEFVASSLYTLMLGQENIAHTFLVRDADSANGLALAIEYRKGLRVFEEKLRNNQEEKSAGSVPFRCVMGGCNLSDKTFKKTLPQLESTLNGKIITGFEKAFVATRFFDDGDVYAGNNYAWIETATHVQVTRIDFDDSLKFLDRLGITPGILEIPPELQYLVDEGSFTKASILAEINRHQERPPLNFHSFHSDLPPGCHLSAERMIEALDLAIALPADQISNIVLQKFQALQAVAGGRPFLKFYNKAALEAVDPGVKGLPRVQAVAKVVDLVLSQQRASLETLKHCIQVEKALKENDVLTMKQLLAGPVMGEAICISFFHYPQSLEGRVSHDFALSNMAQFHHYENDAAAVLEAHFSHPHASSEL